MRFTRCKPQTDRQPTCEGGFFDIWMVYDDVLRRAAARLTVLPCSRPFLVTCGANSCSGRYL
jgi:hypothetical protein